MGASSTGQPLTGHVSVEGRFFPETALRDNLQTANLSIAIESEFYRDLDNARQAITIVPFFRWDQQDSNRSHWDFRELTWQYFSDSWEISIGARKIFWGVTESKHLVDVVNQIDLLESFEGEEKLGQPMVSVSTSHSWGLLETFALIGFRERNYVGQDRRPSIPFPLDSENSIVEGGKLNLAVRWSHTRGPLDLVVSHFHGTAREPRFFVGNRPLRIAALTLVSDNEPVLTDLTQLSTVVPAYENIDQAGLEVQLTASGWLLKMEAINRWGQGPRFAAVTAGIEYALSNLRSTGIELGILAEYSYDERGLEALTPIEDDVFVGARLSLNDVQATQFLAGAIVDRLSGASLFSVDASRRLGERSSLNIQMRAFAGISSADMFLYGLRKDDYVQAALRVYF
ncbi:MAG: hypothetical protein CL483_04525 [Acidobacteria bacterium]|nr:hypothetical protein [Acidobacteriota bacterium]